jgi:hypothetical protein
LVIGKGGYVTGRILSGWLGDLIGGLYALSVTLAVLSVSMPVLFWVGTHMMQLYLLDIPGVFLFGTQASVNASTSSRLLWPLGALVPAPITHRWGTEPIVQRAEV